MDLSNDPFSVVPPDREHVEMTLARGAALREFVALEGTMARMYVVLTGQDHSAATAEFFDLKSHQRIARLRQLVTARPDFNVNVFFSSLLDDVESLTMIRNFIVHAQQIMGAEEVDLASGRRRRWGVRLIPPDHDASFMKLKMNSTHDVVTAVRRFAYVDACLSELNHYFHMRIVDALVQTPPYFGEPHERFPQPGHCFYWRYSFEHYTSKD